MLKKNFKKPVTLGEMVIMVGKLGGYLSRKHDPPVGHELLWKGFNHLQLMCEGYALRAGYA